MTRGEHDETTRQKTLKRLIIARTLVKISLQVCELSYFILSDCTNICTRSIILNCKQLWHILLEQFSESKTGKFKDTDITAVAKRN